MGAEERCCRACTHVDRLFLFIEGRKVFCQNVSSLWISGSDLELEWWVCMARFMIVGREFCFGLFSLFKM